MSKLGHTTTYTYLIDTNQLKDEHVLLDEPLGFKGIKRKKKKEKKKKRRRKKSLHCYSIIFLKSYFGYFYQ